MMYMLSNRDRIVSSSYDQSLLWVTLLLLGLLGVVLSLIFWLVESRALRWYHGFRAAERGSR